MFGGNGGSSAIVDVPEGYRWTGIFGKSAKRLDKIGFLFTATVSSFKHGHQLTKVVYPEEK